MPASTAPAGRPRRRCLRTLDALREFRPRLGRHRPSRRAGRWRPAHVATPPNRDEFFDAVAEVLGARPELLTGDEEGRLGYRGRPHRRWTDVRRNPVLVVDIGGGSTEFMIGGARARRCDLDRRRRRSAHRAGAPLRPASPGRALQRHRLRVTDHLDDVLRELPAVAGAATIIGLGGTVKVAAAVELGLAGVRPGRWSTASSSRATPSRTCFARLATESLAERVHNPGLPADRAEVIVGGCCVLVAVLRRLHAPGSSCRAAGCSTALVAELLERHR